MRGLTRRLLLAVGVFAVGLAAAPLSAQQNPPAVLFESLMDSWFSDDNGLVALRTFDLAFPPEGPAKIAAGLVNAEGEVLAQFEAFPDYKVREGAFARFLMKQPADVQLTEPGIYTLVFVFDGKAITRFPFLLKQTGDGADPYNPQKTYAFDGYWRRLAHITQGEIGGEPIPIFSLWLGGLDMETPDSFQGYFVAELTRDGELIAHSRKQTAFYSNGHFKRREVILYHPHEEREAANAIALKTQEMLVDGLYRLAVRRASDDAPLRSYVFTVAEGKIQPLPKTQLGYEPATDFMVPRVTKKGSTIYEFEEAIWIGSE